MMEMLLSRELGAGAVVLVGLLLGFTLSRGVRRLLRYLQHNRSPTDASIELVDSGRPETIGRIVFWLVVLVALLIGLRLLGAESFDSWQETLIEYGSRGLLGFIVLFLGLGASTLIRELIISFGNTRDVSMLARLAQYVVLAFALLAAFDQFGLDVMLINLGVGAFFLIVISALALSFALGSRAYVGNLVARSELERIRVGDRLRIDEHEGVVTQIYKLGVELATSDGLLTIPGSYLLEQPYLKLNEPNADD